MNSKGYISLLTFLIFIFSTVSSKANIFFDPINKIANLGTQSYKWQNLNPKVINAEDFLVGDRQLDVPSFVNYINSIDEDIQVSVLFPAGRYYLNTPIIFNRGNISVNGDYNNSELIFTSSSLDTSFFDNDLNRSWEGGFFSFKKKLNRSKIKFQYKSTSRYSNKICLNQNSEQPKVNSIIELSWWTTPESKQVISKHILGDIKVEEYGSRINNSESVKLVTQRFRVEKYESNCLTISNRLIHDLRTDWKIETNIINPIQKILLKNLVLSFDYEEYAGHLNEAGLNAIYLFNITDAFISGVIIKNSDSGILIHNSFNVYSDNVKLFGRLGHYGLSAFDSNDILFRDFKIYSVLKHSISANTRCQYCMFEDGYIKEGRLDMHRGYNNHNLFKDIRIDKTWNLLAHGGNKDWGPASGVNNLLENIDVREAKTIECETCSNLILENVKYPENIDIQDLKEKK